MDAESSNLLHMLSSPSQAPTFPFFGVSALILIYAVILYLVIDFNCPADGIGTTEDPRLSGLSLEEIEDLPCFDCGVNITSICAVCLDDLHGGERCRRFPNCNHVFHAHCIDLWLARRLTCPTCRSPFKTNTDLDV